MSIFWTLVLAVIAILALYDMIDLHRNRRN